MATLSVCDSPTSSVPDRHHAVADVNSLATRFAEAVETQFAKNVTALELHENSATSAITDDLEALVRAAVDGKPKAIDGVLRRIRPDVVRYCRTRLGVQDKTSVSADDVAQEVCLAVLTALPSYRDQGRPFLAFVYGIAAHKVADAHRSAARNRAEPVPEIPDCPASAEGPEQQALQGELAEQTTRLLGTLPDKQREILVLRVVVGLSAEETADAVGSTPGAVRVAQHRALSRLRKVLTSEGVV